MPHFYVSTPLYYVNDKPHIGHAYTTIAADVIAKWHRLNGNPTFFSTGTDEHGQKVYRAAQAREVQTKVHVDELVLRFQELWEKLDIQHDTFVRTTNQQHVDVVQAALMKLYEQGDIYADDYEGWYSTSAEKFWTEKDLVDGKCPDSGLPVEWIAERNYFFRMSNYADQLRNWIADHPAFLLPESRRNEVLGYLRKEVGDLCISRLKTRLPWGIPLPFDDDYVTYVWFDALLNYITGLGYHPDEKKCSQNFKDYWPSTYHLLGKDILTTHSVYWSTMLFALGLEPTKHLYAHGWWTIENQKMSKSIGNVVDPHLLIEAYGSDAVRFFLLREVPFGLDGNFSHSSFLTRYNAELANDLGNLVHRSLSMTEKWLGGVIPDLDPSQESDLDLESTFKASVEEYISKIEDLQFSSALDALFALVRKGNKYIDINQPWRINSAGDIKRLGGVMRRCLEVCRASAYFLMPFMPNKSLELLEKLNVSETDSIQLDLFYLLKRGLPVSAGSPLFPRHKELPEIIQKSLEASGLQKEKPQPVKAKSGPKQSFIKSKVFKRIAFQSGTVQSATKNNDVLELKVEVADGMILKISDSYPTDGQELIGTGVVVAHTDDLGSFERINLITGKIVSAAVHPDASKLLHLSVDLGENEPRSIVAGIAERFKPEELTNQAITAVSNLRPSQLRGIISQGMLLAAGGETLQSMVCPPRESIGSRAVAFGDGENVLLQIKTASEHLLLSFSEKTDSGVIIR